MLRRPHIDVQEAVWGLVSRGLAFIDMSQMAPEEWSLKLTQAGFAAARDEEINPDDPTYFTRLESAVQRLVLRYAGTSKKRFSQHAKDQYVPITEEELESLEAEANKSIDLREFVPLASVDPVYFESTHYLGPDKGARHSENVSFNLLHNKCGSRVRNQHYCPVCNTVVERADLCPRLSLRAPPSRYVPGILNLLT